MSTLVKIKNLSRRRLRFGTTGLPAASPTGTGAVVAVDVDDPSVKRDLYRNLGSYAFASDILVAKVSLAAVDTAGGVFAWANPEGANILIHDVALDVTTQSSAACTVSVGVAANATTLNAGMISGQSVAAAGQFKSSGKAQKATSSQFVTGSVASGASAGLVGSAYIYYTLA